MGLLLGNAFAFFTIIITLIMTIIIVISLLFQKSKLPYCDQIEMILVTYVFPELTSERGYMRAKVIS